MLRAIQNETFGSVWTREDLRTRTVWSVLGYELVSRELQQYWDEALTADNHWRVSSFSIVSESNVCIVQSDCPDKPMANEIELAGDSSINAPLGTVHQIP